MREVEEGARETFCQHKNSIELSSIFLTLTVKPTEMLTSHEKENTHSLIHRLIDYKAKIETQ